MLSEPPLPPAAASPLPRLSAAAAPCEVHVECLVRHLRRVLLESDDQRERGHVLFTDGARRYLGGTALGAGGRDSMVLDPRAILEAGFALEARGMILAHNHPSGECRPSQADLDATERLRWLGGMVDLVLLDHLIVTHSAVYSIRAGSLL
jgi:DNA repair protein RadC